MRRQIRLTCQYCDTDECDSVTEIPADWSDVEEVYRFAASGKTIAGDDETRSPLDWFTHIGVCPDCQIAVLSHSSTSSGRKPMSRIRSHTDSEDSIAAALDRLREELTVVRQVLDEIREELEWANQNRGETDHFATTPRTVTSLPLDPAAPHSAEQVNHFSATDVPAELHDPNLKQRGQLF